MKDKNIDLNKIEFSVSKINILEIFQNYPNSCRKFTYHINLNELNFLSDYNIQNYFIKVNNSDILKSHVEKCENLNKFDSFSFEISQSNNLQAIFNFIDANSIKLKKIRFYVNINNEHDDLNLIKDIITHAKHLNYADLFSICLQSFNFTEAVKLNERALMLYPELKNRFHFEPPEGISNIENAIFFTVIFQNSYFQNSSICANFSDAEKMNTVFHNTLEILRSAGFANIPGIFLIACPTCTRTRIDVIELARSIYEKSLNIEKNLKIAVMGCEVNGPGEASQADFGVAGGLNRGVIFKKGKIIKQVALENIENELSGMLNEHSK